MRNAPLQSNEAPERSGPDNGFAIQAGGMIAPTLEQRIAKIEQTTGLIVNQQTAILAQFRDFEEIIAQFKQISSEMAEFPDFRADVNKRLSSTSGKFGDLVKRVNRLQTALDDLGLDVPEDENEAENGK